MYKVKLNVRDKVTSLEELEIVNVSSIDSFDFDDTMIVTCQTAEKHNLKRGDIIVITYEVELPDKFNASTTVTNLRFEYSISGINENENAFTIITDKYNRLENPSIWAFPDRETDDDEDVETNYYDTGVHYDIDCSLPHLLPSSDISDPVIFIDYDDIEKGVRRKLPIECYWLDNYQLRIKRYFCLNDYTEADAKTEEEYELLSEDEKRNYTRINFLYYDNSKIHDYNSFLYLVYDEQIKYYRVPLIIDDMLETLFENGGPVTMTLYRSDVLFNDLFGVGTTRYFKQNISTSVKIPLFSSKLLDTHQERIIKEKFVDVEKKKAINSIVEMEKDIYHPHFIGVDNKNNKVSLPINELVFNLHFRKRGLNDNKWRIKQKEGWFGEDYIDNDGNINLNNDIFFSYEKSSFQSDLLYYLGFKDADIKFQRKKLKKSFLRLSFYDTNIPSNQRLLSYATIFMDSGTLFGKYTRNIENEEDSGIVYYTTATNYAVNGIRNNTEVLKDDDSFIPSENVENYRLSSQFSVKHRVNGMKSAEGFYLYLWKNLTDNCGRTDIYMRVDFNHAGYGRTIPFMLPYGDDKKIKSFSKIIEDFDESKAVSLGTYSNVEKKRYGYTVKEMQKYLHIHFKCYYDKEADEYRYCLDDNTYDLSYGKEDSIFANGKLFLNLYEARLGGEIIDRIDIKE